MPVKTQQIISLQDESFHLESYNIVSILFTQDGFYFITYDKNKNKFLSVESHTIERTNQIADKEVFEQHLTTSLKVISENSKIVSCLQNEKGSLVFVPNQLTWIPLSLFQEQEKEKYILFNFGKIEGDVYYEVNNAIDAVCIYTIYNSVRTTLKTLFPGTTLHPLQNVLAKDFQRLSRKLDREEAAYCFVTPSTLYIQVYRQSRLVLENSFSYQAKQDFIYYLLNIYDKLNLNQETVPLYFSGEILPHSDNWNMLRRYIRHIETVPANNAFSYSYIFNNIEPHRFYHLFNTVSCVLLEELGKAEG